MTKLLTVCQTVDSSDPVLGFFVPWVGELAKKFDRVDIICFSAGSYDLPDHVHVYELGRFRGWKKLWYVLNFYKFFTRLFFTGPDIVFFHMGAIFNILAAPFFLISRFTKTRVVWWKTHGNVNTTGKIASWFVDEIFTAGEKTFPIQSSKRHVVGHGMNTNLFVPPNPDNRTWSGPFEIISVGRISEVKGLEFALEGLAGLGDKYDWHWTLIGPDGDETYRQDLDQRIHDLGLLDKVTYTGSIKNTDLPQYYAKANIILNTTVIDTADKVTLEAMACGCLPVTTSTMVQQNQELAHFTGFALKDSAAITQALENVLAHTPEEMMELQKVARQEIIDNHSLPKLMEKIITIQSK